MNMVLDPPALALNPSASATVKVARWALLLALLSILISPPISNLFQFLLYVMFALSAELRGKLWACRKQPMVLGGLAFFLMLALATTYSEAGVGAGLLSLAQWHKLLFIPIGAALFQQSQSKNFFFRTFLLVATLLAAMSSCLYMLDIAAPFTPLLQGGGPGIILRNYATQGMAFGVAVLVAGGFLLFETNVKRHVQLAWALSIVVLVTNISFVTTGRSGYVVLVASAIALAVGWAYLQGLRLHQAIAAGLVLLLATMTVLWVTPKSRERILQGVHEIQRYKEATEVTSMGVRMHFWTTTPALIAERPLLGWGTGGFEAAYRQKVAGKAGVAGLVTVDPHQQYLKIMTEQGLIGFAVFVAFLISLITQKPAQIFRVMGLGVLFGWCSTSVANAHFSTFTEGTFLYIWLGVTLGAIEPESAPS